LKRIEQVKVKRVQHVSIPVPPGSAAAVRRFYGETLGLPEKAVPRELDASMLTWFDVGEDEHELHCFVDEDYENRSTAQHLCFEVDDLDALRRQIVAAGVELEPEPTAIHNRPRAFVRDPFGNLIEITQINGPFREE
jgi:catechol 2,3-dioxygenase-like lactoylglutathione lyase family enzyme